MTKVAIIQDSPGFLDREETVKKAAAIIEEVAAAGAELVVFPEVFIPGYPAWIWRLRPGKDWGQSEALHQRLLDNSVRIDSDDLAPVRQAAKKSGVTVVCGLNERDTANSGATLYNSVVTISRDGEIANLHRKLMPTNPERMVWGFGDATGLNVVDTPVGRVGGLICWENYMPLARYALYAQGVEIYVAPTYDSGENWIGTMRHIAREGRCWVLCSGVALRRGDLPGDLPGMETLYPADEDWINPGDSAVIAPGGEVVYGPVSNEHKHIVVDIDVQKAAIAKRALDVAGHYSRPDIFTLKVNRKPQKPLVFDEEG